MKNLFLFLVSFSIFYAKAQEPEKKTDTTKINLGETQVIIINTKKNKIIIDGEKGQIQDTIDAAPDKKNNDRWMNNNHSHWAGLDLGYGLLLNKDFSDNLENNYYLDQLKRPIHLSLNFFDHRFRIHKNIVGLSTGLGLSMHIFPVQNNSLLTSTKDSVIVQFDTINKYKRNRLTSYNIAVPLLLEINTKNNESSSIYFQMGVIGSYNFGGVAFRKIKREDYKNKERETGNFGLSNFNCDATFRVGKGDVGIYANYALLPLFDKEQFQEVYPFTFGIHFGF